MAFDPKEFEKKWQAKWEEERLYEAEIDSTKESAFVADMFPYPSGSSMHVGHPRGYVATDVYSRYKRMNGFNVLHPMGWDAFGLPAEETAIENNEYPAVTVERNIATFKSQLTALGLGYDWSREINTTDPEYYKHTQRIFLEFFKKGLARNSTTSVNWCPDLGTVLANEDIVDGKSERGGYPVYQLPMRQWVLLITKYADRLLDDLELLPQWPDKIKNAQREWIGRSEGAAITFVLEKDTKNVGELEVFTTRPDTLFGATYVVLAPEHPLVATLPVKNKKEIEKYLAETAKKTELDRKENKDKSGVRLDGVVAVNPVNDERIPVFVADYVLGSYGTGAVMAVPAHDERDFEFAKKHNLPIRQVIAPRVIDERNPWRENKELIERNLTLSVIYNPKTKKYLCLKWKEQGWTTFISGGIEEGETPEVSARREIKEETGYIHIKLIRTVGETNAKYFAAHKNVNRLAHTTTLLFELEDETQEEVASEEKNIHEAVWLSEDEIVAAKLQHSEFDFLWERILHGDSAYTGSGVLINSGEFSDRNNEEVFSDIIALAKGKKTTNYRIKDWIFSRQRFWGEPFPIVWVEGSDSYEQIRKGKAGAWMPEEPVSYTEDGKEYFAIPVIPEHLVAMQLPVVPSYKPTGNAEGPLAGIPEWVNAFIDPSSGEVRNTSGGDTWIPVKRETNTMPQWAGSSWYWLRYMDPHNTKEPFSKESANYWGAVDVYAGADHAVAHLIYARFWHKVLQDVGMVDFPEPFKRLEFLGHVMADDGSKISKRKGNSRKPEEVIDEVGADAFRVYEMFIGPFEKSVPWKDEGLAGAYRFLNRIWDMGHALSGAVITSSSLETKHLLHKTIQKVEEDIEAFKFNTAISALMICLNGMEVETISKEDFKLFLILLAPFAPHMTEELWSTFGETGSIHLAPWPEINPDFLIEDMVTVVIQINSKKKGEMRIAPTAKEEEALETAKKVAAIASALGDNEPARIIYVPGRILNIVL